MRLSTLVLLLALQGYGWSQSSQQSPAQATSAPTLAAVTLVKLRTTQLISSKHTKAGDEVPLEVTADVKAGDLLVIAAHTPVTATIASVHRAGRGLRRGSLTLEAKAVNDIAGDPIPISGSKSAKPDASLQIGAYTDIVVHLGLTAPVLFLRGDEAEVPKGTKFGAEVERDIPLDAAQLRARMAILDAEKARARSGKATLYFYLASILFHSREEHILFLDGKKVARLRSAVFFQTQVPPGTHAVQCNGHEIHIETEPDQPYYVQVKQEGTWQNHWVPRVVAVEEGEDAVYPRDPSDPKDVFVQ